MSCNSCECSVLGGARSRSGWALVFPGCGSRNHFVFLVPIWAQFAGIPLSFWVQRWAPYWESACSSSSSGSRSWSSSSGTTGHEEAQATMAVPLSFPAHGGMNPLVFLVRISGLVPGIPLSFWVHRWALYWQSACSGMAKWHLEHSCLLVQAWQTWTPYRG